MPCPAPHQGFQPTACADASVVTKHRLIMCSLDLLRGFFMERVCCTCPTIIILHQHSSTTHTPRRLYAHSIMG